MDYTKVVSDAFRLTWSRKYKWLWVLGFFAMSSSGGFPNFGANSFTWRENRGLNINPEFGAVGAWASEHVALIIAFIALLFFIAILMTALRVIASGALIGAADTLDAEEETGWSQSLRVGLANFWSLLGLMLLITLIAFLPIMLLGAFLAIIFLISPVAAAIGAIAALLILLLFMIFFFLVLAVLGMLGTRAVVIEKSGAIAALKRAWGLFRNNIGHIVIFWLISVGISFAFGLALLLIMATLGIPLGVALFFIFLSGVTLMKVGIAAFTGFILLALIMVAVAGFSTFNSIFWTLVFKRVAEKESEAVEPPSPEPEQA